MNLGTVVRPLHQSLGHGLELEIWPLFNATRFSVLSKKIWKHGNLIASNCNLLGRYSKRLVSQITRCCLTNSCRSIWHDPDHSSMIRPFLQHKHETWSLISKTKWCYAWQGIIFVWTLPWLVMGISGHCIESTGQMQDMICLNSEKYDKYSSFA